MKNKDFLLPALGACFKNIMVIDEILGTLSDGMDFEKAVASIFELCRTTEEINRAFDEIRFIVKI